MFFGKRALLAALWLYAMVIFAHFRLPFGARSQLAFSFLYFLSSYLSSYYYLIQENLRDHRNKMGAKWDFKRKKREKSRKLKRKSLYSPFLKGKKERKYRKSKLIIKFRYIFLTKSLIFSFFLLISYRFLILKKRKNGRKNVIFEHKNIRLCQIYPCFKEEMPILVHSLFIFRKPLCFPMSLLYRFLMFEKKLTGKR